MYLEMLFMVIKIFSSFKKIQHQCLTQLLPAAVNSTSFLYAKCQILLLQVQKALDGEEQVWFCCTGGVRFLDHAEVIQTSWVLQNTAHSALPWKKLDLNGRRP
ncbi:hypothetical protein KIL84_016326 [Mauremys mutica]|uniref:Uncharacterized protein n=1 Tax=Mauremys mutica TaxID=74926 RepID=A0A9D3X478_9SAUR|nr:hypothetical protein KIL84_016326 [Mauremys mutica]